MISLVFSFLTWSDGLRVGACNRALSQKNSSRSPDFVRITRVVISRVSCPLLHLQPRVVEIDLDLTRHGPSLYGVTRWSVNMLMSRGSGCFDSVPTRKRNILAIATRGTTPYTSRRCKSALQGLTALKSLHAGVFSEPATTTEADYLFLSGMHRLLSLRLSFRRGLAESALVIARAGRHGHCRYMAELFSRGPWLALSSHRHPQTRLRQRSARRRSAATLSPNNFPIAAEGTLSTRLERLTLTRKAPNPNHPHRRILDTFAMYPGLREFRVHMSSSLSSPILSLDGCRRLTSLAFVDLVTQTGALIVQRLVELPFVALRALELSCSYLPPWRQWTHGRGVSLERLSESVFVTHLTSLICRVSRTPNPLLW